MEEILPRNNRRGIVSSEDVGGKGAGLYKLAKLSRKYGYKVPDFFVVPVEYNGPQDEIIARAQGLQGEGNYAVRSSSPYEDSQEYSFAGIFDTWTDVSASDIPRAIRSIRLSAMSPEALQYAGERGITIEDKMAVIVQRMVSSDYSYGGVIHSTMPSYSIACSVGVGMSVQQVVSPTGSAYVEVHDFLKNGFDKFGDRVEILRSPGNAFRLFEIPERGKGLKNAVEISQGLEGEFGYPVEIEFAWTYDNKCGTLHFLQARPITDIEPYREVKIPSVSQEDLILRADSVRGIGEYEGPAVIYSRVTESVRDFDSVERELREIDSAFPEGYALFVTKLLQHTAEGRVSYGPDYDLLTPNKKVIIEFGNSNILSHAVHVAREKGILYMGSGDLMASFKGDVISKISNGDIVKVVMNGREGVAFKVRDGDNPLGVDYY